MVAVPALIAGHGDEGAVAAVHDLDAPDGEAPVQIDGSVGQDGAAGMEGVDLHIHLHGEGLSLGSGGRGRGLFHCRFLLKM